MNTSNFSGGLLIHDPSAYSLWEKLRNLRFDSGSGPRTFAARLASEQHWTAEFADRVIEEYRRFLLLFALGRQRQAESPDPDEAASSAVQIVPSEAVDKAWHQHLLYTHSYWDDLCHGILGGPLHHLPSEGSSGETVSLDEVYRDTLAAYVRTFGQNAPSDIWPFSESEPPRPILTKSATVSLAKSTAARADRPSLSRAALVGGIPVVGILLLVVLNTETGRLGGTVATAIFFLVLLGALVAMVSAVSEGGRGHRSGTARRRYRDSSGFTAGGDGGGGSFDGGCSHGHGGGHDAGGHSGGDGGHGCGGHGCGGHGCGGGSCGGGGCGGGGCGGGD